MTSKKENSIGQGRKILITLMGYAHAFGLCMYCVKHHSAFHVTLSGTARKSQPVSRVQSIAVKPPRLSLCLVSKMYTRQFDEFFRQFTTQC